jgi:predicted ribosomally synthesized peptide with nif11-like leader
MTLEKAVEFLKKAETDAELKAKLHAGEMAADEAVKLAANMGYTFTVAELNDAMDEFYVELSD